MPKYNCGQKLRDVAGKTTDPREPWYAASDPQKTNLEVGLQNRLRAQT